jgi:hypothetical protein
MGACGGRTSSRTSRSCTCGWVVVARYPPSRRPSSPPGWVGGERAEVLFVVRIPNDKDSSASFLDSMAKHGGGDP